MRNHPMQPVVIAGDGCARFKENKIVTYLPEVARINGVGLNEIAIKGFDQDDYSQLMQLIGYSVSGYGDLYCANRRHVHQADRNAAKL